MIDIEYGHSLTPTLQRGGILVKNSAELTLNQRVINLGGLRAATFRPRKGALEHINLGIWGLFFIEKE